VCANLANRGVKDVLIVCCDGLTGFPEAIAATWPKAMVQTCVVHLIRASMRFVSYTDRKAVAALLRPIYTAPDEETALIALATFADSNLGKKYPAAVASWENAWEKFTPFLAFGPALRKVIYTTNSIVILSQLQGVVDVADGLDRSPIVRAGRAYLQPSSRHGRGRFGVRCSSGGVRLAA
jgi:putative transposase